jgi:hypothetical protein
MMARVSPSGGYGFTLWHQGVLLSTSSRSSVAVEGVAVALTKHADEHRSERPVLLAVDQQLSECATLRVAPELADPIGAVEVGEHQDVEQLGERVDPFLKSTLQFVGAHVPGYPLGPGTSRVTRRDRCTHKEPCAVIKRGLGSQGTGNRRWTRRQMDCSGLAGTP